MNSTGHSTGVLKSPPASPCSRRRAVHPGAKWLGLLCRDPTSGVVPTAGEGASSFDPHRLQASEVGAVGRVPVGCGQYSEDYRAPILDNVSADVVHPSP